MDDAILQDIITDMECLPSKSKKKDTELLNNNKCIAQ